VFENSIKVRQAIAQFLTKIPLELKEEYESLLDDKSYLTIEAALYNLWVNFPLERHNYLKKTKGIMGLSDNNVRLLWLTLSIVTPDYAKELKQSHRIIRMDLPAYGLTGPNTSGDYSPEYYAQFMNHFLEKLGVKKCIIVGNSLGGAIAWRNELRYPTAVSKLVLIDAVGYPMESKSVPVAFQLAGMPVLKNLFQYVTPRFIVQNSIENVYADKTKVQPELVDRYFNLALRAGNRQAFIERMSTFKTLLNDSTYLQIKTIKTPTLILWGDKDLLIPVTVAKNFYADLPNDTLVVLKNLGHTPMEEDPKQTLQVFKSFLIKK